LRCVELGYDRFEDFIDDGWEDSFVIVGSEFSVATSQRALERSESCERSSIGQCDWWAGHEGGMMNTGEYSHDVVYDRG